MLVYPKPLGASVAHRNHVVTKPAVRLAATVRPSADTVHFGNTAFVVTPELRRALDQFAKLMDETMLSQAVAELPQKVTVERTRNTMTLRGPISLIPGHEDDPGYITLSFQQTGALWILNTAQSSLRPDIDAGVLARSILSARVLGALNPVKANSAALARARSDEAAREISVPLSRLAKQFPTQAGKIMNGKTRPVPVPGYNGNVYLQLIFKRDTIQLLVGTLGQTSLLATQQIVPEIDFEFDGHGNIIKSTLREEEERLIRANTGSIGRAAVDALVFSVATDQSLDPRIRDLMYHAAGPKPEAIRLQDGYTLHIEPGQIILRKSNQWGMQWNASVDPKQPYAPPDPNKPLLVNRYSNMELRDGEPEKLTVERISKMLDEAYVKAMGGYFTAVTGLHNEFVGRARVDGKPNPFFDPVDQLMGWNFGRNVVVYGDLDDLLHNGDNLPGTLKSFARAKGLDSPEAAKERFGEGIPFEDAIVLGWYNEMLPGMTGDVLLLVMDHDDPINKPPRMVLAPKSTPGKPGFNRQNFSRVVTTDNMRAIAEGVQFPNHPVTRQIGDQEITADAPRVMMSILADNVEGLLTEVPSFREVTHVLLGRLEAQYAVLKSTARGTIAGIQDEIDVLQAKLRGEYIKKAREDRAKERQVGQQAYEEARLRAAQAMGTSGVSGKTILRSLGTMVSQALGFLKDEITIHAEWYLWESRQTPAYHHKQEVNARAKAVEKGFRLNDRDIAAMVHALSDINNKLQQISDISARMNQAEAEVELLSISSPNLVASMSSNGKGYEPFSFDERVARIRELLENQIRDYVTVTNLRNTVVNNLASITERIPKTGASIAGVVGRGQNRLTAGHDRVQGALTAGQGLLANGQLQLPSSVPSHIAAKLSSGANLLALPEGDAGSGTGPVEVEYLEPPDEDYNS